MGGRSVLIGCTAVLIGVWAAGAAAAETSAGFRAPNGEMLIGGVDVESESVFEGDVLTVSTFVSAEANATGWASQISSSQPACLSLLPGSSRVTAWSPDVDAYVTTPVGVEVTSDSGTATYAVSFPPSFAYMSFSGPKRATFSAEFRVDCSVGQYALGGMGWVDSFYPAESRSIGFRVNLLVEEAPPRPEPEPSPGWPGIDTGSAQGGSFG